MSICLLDSEILVDSLVVLKIHAQVVKNIFRLFEDFYMVRCIGVFYIRFWLNTDVKTTDARLGWIQKTFELTGDEMRQVIVTEPRVIMFGVGPLEVSTWGMFFFRNLWS